jgi:hypothetical protein
LNNESINIDCEVTVNDVVAWNDYHWQKNSNRQLTLRLLRFVFLPVFALLFILGILMFSSYIITGTGSFDLFIFPIIMGGCGILYCLFWPKIKSDMNRNRLIKTYSQGKNGVVGQHKYSITQGGVHDITAVDVTTIKWDAIENIVQTKTHMFIVVRPLTALIVPRSGFSNDSAFSQFVEDTKYLFNKYTESI